VEISITATACRFGSSNSGKEAVAKDLLKRREATLPVGAGDPRTNRVTLSELLDEVLADYRVNERRSLKTETCYIDGHLRPTSGTARRPRSPHRREGIRRASPERKGRECHDQPGIGRTDASLFARHRSWTVTHRR